MSDDAPRRLSGLGAVINAARDVGVQPPPAAEGHALTNGAAAVAQVAPPKKRAKAIRAADSPAPTPPIAPETRERISRGREGSRNRTIRLDDEEQNMVREIEYALYRAGQLRGRIGPTMVHRVLVRMGHAMLAQDGAALVRIAESIEDPDDV